jgi:hypothetical protein
MTVETRTCKNTLCRVEFTWPGVHEDGLCWDCHEKRKTSAKNLKGEDHKAKASGEY